MDQATNTSTATTLSAGPTVASTSAATGSKPGLVVIAGPCRRPAIQDALLALKTSLASSHHPHLFFGDGYREALTAEVVGDEIESAVTSGHLGKGRLTLLLCSQEDDVDEDTGLQRLRLEGGSNYCVSSDLLLNKLKSSFTVDGQTQLDNIFVVTDRGARRPEKRRGDPSVSLKQSEPEWLQTEESITASVADGSFTGSDAQFVDAIKQGARAVSAQRLSATTKVQGRK